MLTNVADLGDRVTVVTISEFGRRAGENGGGGLDHGWGNMMLLAGGGVKGGYHGTWPGLDASGLVDGDLAVTTDYRTCSRRWSPAASTDRSPTPFPSSATHRSTS